MTVATTAATSFASFAAQRTVILTTYRRDGTPVATPVHIAVEGDRAFIRTYAKAWKARRLARRPEAELSLASNGTQPALLAMLRPSEARPVGAPVRVRVAPLTGEEARLARAALARKYPLLQGLVVPLSHRLMRTRTVNMELIA